MAITCLVITIGFYMSRESTNISSVSASNLAELGTELSENDLTMYDGLEVMGSDVINFMKKRLGEYTSSETSPLYVYVKTSTAVNTYYNGASNKKVQDFTDTQYIKPTAKFAGEVIRDTNKVIIGVKFIQK